MSDPVIRAEYSKNGFLRIYQDDVIIISAERASFDEETRTFSYRNHGQLITNNITLEPNQEIRMVSI